MSLRTVDDLASVTPHFYKTRHARLDPAVAASTAGSNGLAAFLSGIDTPEARRNPAMHFLKCFGQLDDLEDAYRRHMELIRVPDTATAFPD